MKPSKSSIIKLHNSFKRQAAENNCDLVDRISDLHDSILGLILSNLPTKNAVSTTLLSKRWKSLWMTVNNLNFCYEEDRCYGNESAEDIDMKFIRFVNRVLRIHGGRFLNKFCLVWKRIFITHHVSGWMSALDKRYVPHQQLFLCTENPLLFIPEPLEIMPITSLFSCDSLRSLELNGTMYVSASIVVSLPRLETLKLVKVYFQYEETFHKLISGCPILKYLHLNLDIRGFTRKLEDEDVFKYRITSPSLRRLELIDKDWKIIRILELEASLLEYLKLDGLIPHIFVQGSRLSSLVEADLGVLLPQNYQDKTNSLVKGVHSFECAKALTLSSRVMWILSNSTISLSTKFTRLTKLVAGVFCCYCSSLHDFIQSSDSLQVLKIRKVSKNASGRFRGRSLRTMDNDIDLPTFISKEYKHDHSNWTAHVVVPKCLSNSLKEVSFEGYTGSADEREMISYLLKHGCALEVMQVTCGKYFFEGKQIEWGKDLIRRFPRKSPACKVEFIEWA